MDRFFDDFFSAPDTSKCRDCGATDTTDRIILYTTDEGDPVWVCPSCRAQRDQESHARAERAAQQVAEWQARDNWEEG